jgi:hypothetical protein
VGPAADPEVDVGRGDAQVGEEGAGHAGVVVLTGVDDHVLAARPPRELGGDRCQLDELGARPDHAEDLHDGAEPIADPSPTTPAGRAGRAAPSG